MGYRDDAFFNLTSPDIGEPSYDKTNSAPYAFPDKRIRFMEAQAELRGDAKQKYAIKRGYIRGLPQPGIAGSSSFTSLKCQFQFNPQTIEQSVQMSNDVLLPMLSDPAQFSQPLGKSTNFNFDLIFDRSFEVSRGPTVPVSEHGQIYDNSNANILNGVDYLKDVSQIGVHADLQLLYAIIGQGFSKELIDFQTARLSEAFKRETAANLPDANSKAGQLLANNGSGIGAAAQSAVSANYGNSAFILPAPVRVLFSTLFMVDGFVTGTTVQFLKFSTNMVPVQARVTISMEAMYIGFAKKQTFLTNQLEQSAIAAANIAAQQESQQQSLVKNLKQTLGLLYFGWSYTDDTPSKALRLGAQLPFGYDANGNPYAIDIWHTASPQLTFGKSFSEMGTSTDASDDGLYVPAYVLVYNDSIQKVTLNTSNLPERTIQIGFSSLINNGIRGNRTQIKSGIKFWGSKEAKTTVQTLLTGDTPVSLNLSWSFYIYGPYPSESLASADAKNKSLTSAYSNPLGSYSGTMNSNDSNFFWNQVTNASNKSSRAVVPSNSASDYGSYKNDKWYVWQFKVSGSASQGDLTVTQSEISTWGYVSAINKPMGAVYLDWGTPALIPNGRF
jgi:hypothetical protein